MSIFNARSSYSDKSFSSKLLVFFVVAFFLASAQAGSFKFVDTAKSIWANPLKGQALEETRTLSDFRTLYSEIPMQSRDTDDEFEGIVPTPGAPSLGNWQAGDVVIFTRTGEASGNAYRRTTRYQRQSNGNWGRTSNVVKVKALECSEGVCTSPF
jgi:hypothetical protein